MIEQLGIAAELAARRAKYARYAYVAPQDRVMPVVQTKKPKHEPPRIKLARTTIRKRGNSRARVIDRPPDRKRIEDIVHVAAEVFGVKPEDLIGPSQKRAEAWPRHAAWHIMAKVLRISLTSAAQVFDRDHSTCATGIQRAKELRRTDKSFAMKSRHLARELRKLWSVK
jgi:chromosomal replication initiation ATPase DnaA